MFKCKYCNKNFKSKKTIKQHQKTAKYCLKIQKKPDFKCEYCNKEINKSCLTRHYKSCLEYNIFHEKKKYEYKVENYERLIENYEDRMENYENQIKYLKDQVKCLQNKLENVAVKAVSKPTTTNTTNITNIINMDPLTLKYIKEKSKYLTIEHIKRGAEGYAEYAIDNLKDKVEITDINRRNAKFKNSQNKIVKDVGMSTILQLLGAGINETNKKLITKWVEKEMSKMKREGYTEFMIEKRVSSMKKKILFINEMAKGNQTKLGSEICKYMCQKLGSENTREIMEELDYDMKFIIEESEEEIVV